MALNDENILHQTKVVVLMIPFPAQAHLNQLLHLSRQIVAQNIPVHYVSTITHIRQATLRHQNSIPNIHFHAFEVPPFVSPPPNPNNPESDFPSHLIPSFEASTHLREPVGKLLQSLSSQAKRVIVIHDSLMASVAQDAINMPNVENYTFHIFSAFNNAVYLWQEKGRPHVGDFLFPEIPSDEGCIATQFKGFLSAQYEFLNFSHGRHIYNTSRAIEGPYIDFLERLGGGKKVWALGPLNLLAIEKKDSTGLRHPCMEWLDKQEPNSVIYVSFGTTTTLTEEQIKQIATGLEQSKQKFIWVLRDADKGNIFDENEEKRHYLPNGFEERVKGMGVVVRDWAPQLEILSHPSTGGFMSHCGWNSCTESFSMGVPIATWPMHSDQPRNAALVTEVLKVGLVVKDWSQRNALVTASNVENCVRRLMQTKEGEEMRERAVRLKNDIHRAMNEGGVSRMEMESFISHITY
ncbi:zeatin O-glucosyltransferase-like [Vigna radiata var. radiata]|uniref:Glycosyltransferase n=1 Tax=Vigna radiata var. radiata TaxID=3916 RepID=A0A1S3UZA3_VIGRR|nr:zeatin O-glucosyltransferase-like [Vigna radiata var. radiata]